MVSDQHYDLCRSILEDSTIEEEDKTERLEELLGKEAGLSGHALENAVLDALWKHRNAQRGEVSETPLRHHVIRRSSPAPWQINRAPTPLGSPPPLSSSPALSVGFPASRPSFSRQKSSAQSPFGSPRPSPRLALAQPIPHSPSLNAYEFSDSSPAPDIYGDYGHENVDWLLADETASNASSTATAHLSAAAPEWVPQPDMSPYDILRSVLGDRKTDDEIEDALNKHSYDLGATIAALLGTDTADAQYTGVPSNEAKVLVGKSMSVNQARPSTPSAGKSSIVCKYWLASGSCLRADCRFAHDTSGYLCKYWMNGNCLAGDACQFSHDPALLVNHLSVGEASPTPHFPLQDQNDQFPSLSNQNVRSALQAGLAAGNTFVPTSQKSRSSLGNLAPGSRPHSRPNSRHQNRPETPSSLAMDDPEAFPSLGSLSVKRGAKQYSQRSRHGPGSMERETPSSLADVVRMSPSPNPAQARKTDPTRKIRTYGGSEGATARKIPEPQHIPWLETGARANQQYMKYRQEAIKHGSIRNKFLQSAAQAWNRNDARAAKALSLRGQAENDAMRKAHREAAKALYDERNPHLSAPVDEDEEMYIDLHGLHPEEAIEYLENILSTQAKRGRRIIYAITGTGHHSKNGKDKVGKGVRNWLNEWGYTFREFSVPGERGGYIGGVLGVDITSRSRQPISAGGGSKGEDEVSPTPAVATSVGSKIQVLKREEVPA
ncbi:hypothetical protein A1O3_06236 [Capronia epimyces CBS 606.96]|uniref:Uncharacterized protein n=1 Tax=Capronia epimyces CBS 606.96 TaxID=1182542 RepID=W9XQF0_9EURO|nr:uncharacterized protein A1O3_06236 [Capronia epimyces CBS 606.96]EXJ82423.1 hypothetical protein A1O3_06236 [Capronia epimyces CBS 606.96]